MASSNFSYNLDPAPTLSDGSVPFRLLEVYPPESPSDGASVASHEQDSLHCRLFWTTLATCPLFKAVSYTWGSSERTNTILISSQSFPITASVNEALREFRSWTTSTTVLWIDQICIDQSNTAEKTQQVSNMDQIYQSAEQVLVWLGPSAHASDTFMYVLDTVGKEAEDWGLLEYFATNEKVLMLRYMKDDPDPQDSANIEFNQICDRALPHFTEGFLHAMLAWHARPWFERVWVLQEFGLARQPLLVCGSKTVSADRAMLARHIFDQCVNRLLKQLKDERLLVSITKNCNTLQTFISSRRRRLDYGESLYELLKKAFVNNDMKATEPCDVIYGLLALANDSNQLKIQVDYNIKDQIDLIFTRAARKMIERGQIDLIANAQAPKNFSNLPSWVPDWTATIQSPFAEHDSGKWWDLASASGDCTLELVDQANERVLRVTGVVVDHIDSFGDICAVDNYDNLLALVLKVEELCVRSKEQNEDIYPSSTRRDEATWRTPIGDIEQTEIHDNVRARPSYAESYLAFRTVAEYQIYLREKHPPTEKTLERWRRGTAIPDLRNKATSYASRVQRMAHKRPFISKRGYVGMGPRDMQPEDIIVVLLGAKVPYVVRPVQGRTFRLVGDCYCDGIMYGELAYFPRKEEFFLE